MRHSKSGQSLAEMVVFLPMLLMMAAGAIFIVYMCWQGVKVQQAANMAARVEGEERVAGGTSAGSIREVNGLGIGGDEDITANGMPDASSLSGKNSTNLAAIPTNSVYGKYRSLVRGMFGAGEIPHLFVPPPVLGANTDRVKVTRVMTPPSVFGMQMTPVVIDATAYGGEDSHMYALPRWGCTGSNCDPSKPYWQQILKDPNNGN